ncbi:MAG: hypothetical protein ACKODW_01855, partial [Methylophilaceae bacterium]
ESSLNTQPSPPSFPRRRESSAKIKSRESDIPGLTRCSIWTMYFVLIYFGWIPACAGMTAELRGKSDENRHGLEKRRRISKSSKPRLSLKTVFDVLRKLCLLVKPAL